MKHCLLLSTVVLACSSLALAQSPITINHSTFPLSTATREYTNIGTVQVAGITAPVSGGNQTWDYSMVRTNIPPMGGAAYAAPSVANPNFPNATLGAHAFFNNGTNLEVEAIRYFDFNANGLQDLGFSMPQHRFKLTAITGGANDSLIIPAQNFHYNNVFIVKLPITAGSKHTSRYRVKINGEVTVASLGLNKTPVRFVLSMQRTDSVAAWGTLRIPAPNGPGTTQPFPTLMRRRLQQEFDTLYINNVPAPAALVDALELWPFLVGKTNEDAFYRLNSTQPLLELKYDPYNASAPFTRLTAASYSAEPNLVITSNRGSLAKQAGSVSVYPNPSVDGQLTVMLGNGKVQPVSLTVFDLAGRQVATATGTTGQPTSALRNLKAGAYLVEVRDANNLRSTVKVNVE